MDHHEEHYRAKRHIYKRSAEKQGHEEDNFEVFLHKVTGLMNFNTPKLKEGIKRYVLKLPPLLRVLRALRGKKIESVRKESN